MTVRERFEQLMRLSRKKILIIQIMALYYTPTEMSDLLDELIEELSE